MPTPALRAFESAAGVLPCRTHSPHVITSGIMYEYYDVLFFNSSSIIIVVPVGYDTAALPTGLRYWYVL